MKNDEQMKEQIKKLAIEKLNLTIDLEEVSDELVFGTAGGFDSTSLLEFILALEEEFDAIVPDEDLTPENFASISSITTYFSKLEGAG